MELDNSKIIPGLLCQVNRLNCRIHIDEDNCGLVINGPTGCCSSGMVTIYGDVGIVGPTGETGVSGSLAVQGDTDIGGSLYVSGNTEIDGSATVAGNVDVTGNTHVSGSVTVSGNTDVTGNTHVTGSVTVSQNLGVTGNIGVYGTIYQGGYIFLPTGTILMWYGSEASVPGGWGICDGRTLLGYTTPDLRGRFVLASGQGSGLTNRTPGQTGGEETHTLTVPEMPSHSHTSNAIGGYGNYGLCIANGSNTVTSTDASVGELNVWTSPGALTIDNTGGGGAHNNMPPFYVLVYIMKCF